MMPQAKAYKTYGIKKMQGQLEKVNKDLGLYLRFLYNKITKPMSRLSEAILKVVY
jgi:hypothetical protein